MMKKINHPRFLAALCAFVAVASFAQTHSVVTPANEDIQKEIQRIDKERKVMFDANNPATQNARNNFPHIPTPAFSNVDIETIAKRYEQRAEARKADDLMIFVSFTMPAESLKRIVAQARTVGASVVLNGFKDNSLKATTEAIKELGEHSGNVLINPNAFAKYEIKTVPTVVLTRPDALTQMDKDGCAMPDTYVAIGGDVSLDYALDQIIQRDASFEDLAARYHRQLKQH
jgi:conjugal transfer pilus assembly protein TrbC